MHAVEQRTDAAGHPAASSPHGPDQLRTETVDAVLRSPGLPLGDAVRPPMEAAFGTDFGDVRLHSDTAAAQSATHLGAHAYTVGEHVVLGPGAGHHTLAHELAHVVQQRRAPAAPGPLALSRPGDASERAADAAAHQVASGGRAAAGLIGTSRRQVSRQPNLAVQQKEVQESQGGALRARRSHKPSLQEKSDASTALMIAADIIQNDMGRQLEAAPAQYAVALWKLYAAKRGHTYQDNLGNSYSGTDRLKALDEAIAGLRPAITLMQRDPAQAEWIDGEFTPYLGTIRESALLQQAEDRVKGSATIENKTVEFLDDAHPREQASQLRRALTKLIYAIARIDEHAIQLGHYKIHHAAQEMFEGNGRNAHGFGKWAGHLVELQNALGAIQGLLLLTDEEFRKELLHPRGVFSGIASYTELVKACVQFTGGAVQLAITYGQVIMRVIGNKEMSLALRGVATSVGLKLGEILPGIEIFWGIMVLIDPHASSEKKGEGALSVALGTAWYTGKYLGKGMATVGELSALGGGIATLEVAIPHLYLKELMKEYKASVIGWDEMYLRSTFKYMDRSSQEIRSHNDAMRRAHDLMVAEKDPEKAAALQKAEQIERAQTQYSLDDFLKSCTSGGWREPWRPGGWGTLRDIFARLMHFRGATTTAETGEGAKQTVAAIQWCFDHAGHILRAEANNTNIEELEPEVKRTEQDKKQEEQDEKRGRMKGQGVGEVAM